MFKKLYIIISLLIVNNSIALGNDALHILQKVDEYRSPFAESQIDITVSSYKKDKLYKAINYIVYSKSGESLVNIKTGASKGNRVLLSKKGMYLAVKKSSRQIRITPMQRLMGQASFGDLASLQLATDYVPTIINRGKNTIKLQLIAKTKNATYQKLHLWVNNKYAPIKADAFFASGKLFKHIKYNVKNKAVESIEYVNPQVKNKKTIMLFNKVKSKKLHKRYFTPSGMRGKIG